MTNQVPDVVHNAMIAAAAEDLTTLGTLTDYPLSMCGEVARHLVAYAATAPHDVSAEAERVFADLGREDIRVQSLVSIAGLLSVGTDPQLADATTREKVLAAVHSPPLPPGLSERWMKTIAPVVERANAIADVYMLLLPEPLKGFPFGFALNSTRDKIIVPPDTIAEINAAV